MPHSIIVDQTGERYMNESDSYVDAGHAILDRQKQNGKAIHSWLILESRDRNKYLFGEMLPRMTPKKAIGNKCNIDIDGLKTTVSTFNKYAKKGIDEGYGRGNSVYDSYYGDPTYRKPNLGTIEKPPFYACKIYPGDLGTKGWILANEHRQAMKDGQPLKGLYATGNCSASVMGDVYPGPGSTLGPTTVFGYIFCNAY
ncbi:succinate dehydrogenase/fumarate reductase flavoprotein subunit [Virgibacillus natechei]|uniref:Succinate dehydrogenase/fumarate reductase flavoprotein subunit n=2 Tax=Virgibacillus natechei TaxID=1216297 RepID=A0ABS4IEE7_9BACI|nr:succinate dehydrogenase/fumarate reductase flavoprotein subunit [Virgibacillus natechei]